MKYLFLILKVMVLFIGTIILLPFIFPELVMFIGILVILGAFCGTGKTYICEKTNIKAIEIGDVVKDWMQEEESKDAEV